MNERQAEELIGGSIRNLEKFKGSITENDLQVETINVACRYILEKYGSKLKQVHDVEKINLVIEYNALMVIGDVEEIVSATQRLFPLKTKSRHPHTGDPWHDAMIKLILPNICWAGMWGFLRGYFMQHHRISIDNQTFDSVTFLSKSHDRFERGIKVSSSKVDRLIKLDFIENKHQVEVSISPSLSPKTARLVKKEENGYLLYRGDDPDYQFEIYFDDLEDVERFVLKLLPRSLKIEYHA